jgi:hypothetical protein
MKLFNLIYLMIFIAAVVNAQEIKVISGDSIKVVHPKDTLLHRNNDLYLRTSVDDAYVFSGDSLIGHTPMFISKKIGQVKLEKTGYETKEVNLGSLSSGEKIPLIFTGKPVQQSFFESTAFKLLISGITIFGAVTAYYKIKADKKFDEYQTEGNSDALNLTHRYDLISGISFAAMQVNFGLLIYYFLRD